MKLSTINILVLLIYCASKLSWAAEHAATEGICPPVTGQVQYSSSSNCPATDSTPFPIFPLQSRPEQSNLTSSKNGKVTPGGSAYKAKAPAHKIIIYFFRGKECPHCEQEKAFLTTLKTSQPSLDIRDYEVWHNKENAALLASMLEARGVQPSGVPITLINDQLFTGFTAHTRSLLMEEIEQCLLEPCVDPAEVTMQTGFREKPKKSGSFTQSTTATDANAVVDTSITIPLLGAVDARNASIPLLTLVIAGMDSFNPCAFFVLLALLGMLVHARSRNRMLLTGGIFVFFSGFIYFLFMAAWLNLFLVMGHVEIVTAIAGVVSVIIAAFNIKDFFLFKQGLSLSIPDSAKPKLFERMRSLLRASSLASMLIGATVLAIIANSYELLCTAGFPMVFTRILTLNRLPATTYYLYLALYNIIYVVPLLIIVIGFTLTLGKRQLSAWQGRVLKLVSGFMMLGLGGVLLLKPALLSSLNALFFILAAALGGSVLVATISKRWLRKV